MRLLASSYFVRGGHNVLNVEHRIGVERMVGDEAVNHSSKVRSCWRFRSRSATLFDMTQHRFQVGDLARIVTSASTNSAQSLALRQVPRATFTLWTIVRLVPPDEHGPKYHVRADHWDVTRRLKSRCTSKIINNIELAYECKREHVKVVMRNLDAPYHRMGERNDWFKSRDDEGNLRPMA
jgi:hypothetical protein